MKFRENKTKLAVLAGILIFVFCALPVSAFAEGVADGVAAGEISGNPLTDLHRRSAAIGLALYLNNHSLGDAETTAALLEKFAEVNSNLKGENGIKLGHYLNMAPALLDRGKSEANKHRGRLNDASLDDKMHRGWDNLPELPEQASQRAHGVLDGLRNGQLPGNRELSEKYGKDVAQLASQNRRALDIARGNFGKGKNFGQSHRPDNPGNGNGGNGNGGNGNGNN